MNKFIFICFSSALVFSFVSCENKSEEKIIKEEISEKNLSENKSFDIPYNIPIEKKNIINKIIKGKPGWRIALKNDNRNQLLSKYQKENPGYEPYFIYSIITMTEKRIL